MKLNSKFLPVATVISLAPFVLSKWVIAEDAPASQATKPVVVTDGSVKIDAGSATKVVVSKISPDYTTAATLTAGALVSACRHGSFTITGYSKSPAIGTYVPTGLTGGQTVIDVVDVTGGPCGAANSELAVSGFTANPGTTWLTSITCNGVKQTTTGATFGYSSGTASWIWSGANFKFVSGTKYSCSIVYS